MLSSYQCESIAYLGDGEFLCRGCARARFGDVTVFRLDHGLSCGLPEWAPLSRYDVGLTASERGYCGDPSHATDEWGYCEACAVVVCDGCLEVIE